MDDLRPFGGGAAALGRKSTEKGRPLHDFWPEKRWSGCLGPALGLLSATIGRSPAPPSKRSISPGRLHIEVYISRIEGGAGDRPTVADSRLQGRSKGDATFFLVNKSCKGRSFLVDFRPYGAAAPPKWS